MEDVILCEMEAAMFSKKLKQLRKEKGYTQRQLATLLQTAESTIGMYEQGRRMPGPKMVHKIEQVLELPDSYLMQELEQAQGIDLLSSEIKRRLSR